MFYRLASADGRIVPQVGCGIVVDGEPGLARSAPPRLGEHTDDVFADWLGMSNGDRRNLLNQDSHERT